MARFDERLLRPVRHGGRAARADLAVLRAREALVRARTLLVNHVRDACQVVRGVHAAVLHGGGGWGCRMWAQPRRGVRRWG